MKNFLAKGNWGLKLLALILAIVVYHALKTEHVRPNAHERSLFQYR